MEVTSSHKVISLKIFHVLHPHTRLMIGSLHRTESKSSTEILSLIAGLVTYLQEY
jgi:hypothetical protein